MPRRIIHTFRLSAPCVHPDGFIFNEAGSEEAPLSDHQHASPDLVRHYEARGMFTYLANIYLLNGVRVGPSAWLALPWSGGAR